MHFPIHGRSLNKKRNSEIYTPEPVLDPYKVEYCTVNKKLRLKY